MRQAKESACQIVWVRRATGTRTDGAGQVLESKDLPPLVHLFVADCAARMRECILSGLADRRLLVCTLAGRIYDLVESGREIALLHDLAREGEGRGIEEPPRRLLAPVVDGLLP